MSEQTTEDEQGPQHAFGKKFKHTLDSDEEDDEVDAEKYNILDTDLIEGTEKATVDFDGEIKITPFNMDEELETGHFDRDGTYIFNKEVDIRDNWLDNIDWARVKRDDTQKIQDSDDDTDKPSVNIEDLYCQVVELLQPGESLEKAIQRYGKECREIRKSKTKKQKVETKVEDNFEQQDKGKESKEKMMKLSSIADQLLSTGDMNIYQRKMEEFQLHLRKCETSKASPSTDMFGEDFDSNTVSTSDETGKIEPATETVQWEFKWEDSPDAPVYGPHTSQEMLAWTNEGYFKDGVLVRRNNSEETKFYSSKRIDFELYI